MISSRRILSTLIALTLAVAARATIAMPCQDNACRLAANEAQQIRSVPVDQRIAKFVRDNQLPSFTKNGKLFFATNQQRASFAQGKNGYLAQLSPNLVEFFITPGFHHLYTRVGDNTYSRISGLSESSYYTSSSERIGVIAHLTDTEMGRLKTYIDEACRNPMQKLGPFNYGGGRPPQASNCTSWITNAQIGDRGETLARLLGVWESGMPQSFLGSLMSSSSNRVKAIVVHNPTRDFNPSYELNLR
jgi:hypothetical protein